MASAKLMLLLLVEIFAPREIAPPPDSVKAPALEILDPNGIARAPVCVIEIGPPLAVVTVELIVAWTAVIEIPDAPFVVNAPPNVARPIIPEREKEAELIAPVVIFVPLVIVTLAKGVKLPKSAFNWILPDPAFKLRFKGGAIGAGSLLIVPLMTISPPPALLSKVAGPTRLMVGTLKVMLPEFVITVPKDCINGPVIVKDPPVMGLKLPPVIVPVKVTLIGPPFVAVEPPP
jgi:hypothetical protein